MIRPKSMLAANAAWAHETCERTPGFFDALARGQNPRVLWIGCSDSRPCSPPRAPADVAPLKALRVSADLDGSAGLNRGPVPAHQAELNTDLQAVRVWIEIRSARNEATRREAERLRPWALVAKGKPLSSLNTMDAADYTWSGSRPTRSRPSAGSGGGRVERFDPAWRVRRPAVRAQP